MARWSLVLGIVAWSSLAHADLSAVELQSRGEDLAKAGRYAEAIDAFKAADKIEVRASHACLIALAYARRELWGPAEIWNAVCESRAKPDDPTPEWHEALEQQIHSKIDQFTPVTFVVTPANAEIALQDFSDVTFKATTLHLAAGPHSFVVHASGYVEQHRDIVVVDATPQHLSIALEPVPVAPVVRALPTSMSTSKKLVIGGVVTAGVGVIAYGVMGLAYLQLKDNKGFSGSTETLYDVMRPTAIGLWVVGGGLVLVGALLHRNETVAAVPINGGAMVAVGWRQ